MKALLHVTDPNVELRTTVPVDEFNLLVYARIEFINTHHVSACIVVDGRGGVHDKGQGNNTFQPERVVSEA